MRVRIYAPLLLALLPSTWSLAQEPPVPSSGADLFVPLVPGVLARDFCVGNSACQFGMQEPVTLATPGGRPLQVDALGWQYPFPDQSKRDTGLTCQAGQTTYVIREIPFYRVSPEGVSEFLGAIRDRCEDFYFQDAFLEGMGIDAINGSMHITLSVRNFAPFSGNPGNRAHVIISGLPTLLDIILSYQPPSSLSFNVPVRPEGLAGADSFGVYAGALETVADLSQAAPLQCTVPAGRPPVPGEQLTVSDTLPDPAVGAGRYYVAAVRHGAQVRAGRSSIGGVMHGRNAAILPGCP